jgi:hypothetical protein
VSFVSIDAFSRLEQFSGEERDCPVIILCFVRIKNLYFNAVDVELFYQLEKNLS